MSRYFRTWGKTLEKRVRFLSYDIVGDPAALPNGTYVFGDVDRLSAPEKEQAQFIWSSLADWGSTVRLYNNPARCVRRYELLRRLYKSGRNAFNVFRLDELGPEIRFPAFVRYAERHKGALTRLLPDIRSLRAAIERLVAAGHDPAALIVVEFQDTSAERIYRKYSAMRVGDRVIARHILFSTDWQVKAATYIAWSPEMVEEERRFQIENPHCAVVTSLFQLAEIDFGRMDYAVCDGEIQVWEINTNPLLLPPPEIYKPYQMPNKLRFSASLNAALRRIDSTHVERFSFTRLFRYRPAL